MTVRASAGRPFDPTLYLVTDTLLCGDRGVPGTVRAAVAGGVTTVQVRAKDASDRERLALVRAVQEVLVGTGVALFVDDAVDIALLAGVDGVHLGQSDLPADEVRRLVGPDLLLGLSVSNPAEVLAAPVDALDYFGVGPVWATSTKPLAAAPLGPAGLAEVVDGAPLPSVAIGGIHPDNLLSVRDSGVVGFCVVSEICAAADPSQAARDLRRQWAGS